MIPRSKLNADLKHGREVEHGDVRLAVVVDGEVEVRHLVLGGKVGGVPGVVEEALLVDVGVGEQLDGVGLVLDEDAALQQALLLRRHHKVVSLVLQDKLDSY